MKTGIIITGIPMPQTPTGGILQETRPTIMTTHGDLRGDGMAVTAHTGATAVAGVWDCPGVGAAAGIWAGDTHLIGAAITHTGVVITAMDILTAAGATVADIGVETTILSTEGVLQAEEDSTHTTEALPINTESILQTDSEEVIPIQAVSETEIP